MSIEILHQQIDNIDDQIVPLLEERLKLAVKTLEFKSLVENPGREKEILLRITGIADERLSDSLIKIFKAVFTESKALQSKSIKLD